MYNLSLNNWYYLVGAVNKTGSTNIYLDVGYGASEINTSLPVDTNAELKIGFKETSARNYSFKGLIDNVRIWNRSLSYEEISRLHKTDLSRINNSLWVDTNYMLSIAPANYSYALFVYDG